MIIRVTPFEIAALIAFPIIILSLLELFSRYKIINKLKKVHPELLSKYGVTDYWVTIKSNNWNFYLMLFSKDLSNLPDLDIDGWILYLRATIIICWLLLIVILTSATWIF